jgi:2-polyprenyl-6-methoxyphenol hydroxylase-like FAD-dependent oxidoreductase
MPRKPAEAPQSAAKPKAKGKVAKGTKSAPKAKMGAPTTFDKRMAAIICIRIAEGESLREIVRTPGMPDRSTVYDWLLRHPDFADQYTRAREEQADTLADEIIAIADEQPEIIPVLDKRTGELIEHKLDNAFLQWQKNRIDARKWTAMKLKPKKYGERVALAGDADSPIKVEAEVQAENLLNALLKNSELKKQANE